MSRQTIIALSFAAALLLGVFVWIWLTSAQSPNALTPMATEGGGKRLTKDAQSPVLTQEPPEPEKAEPQKQTAAAPEADTGPYKFEKWEDAANHLAELMGQRYDELLAEGKDSKTARIQAYNEVLERIFYKNEDPAFKAALVPYLPSDHGTEEERAKGMPLSEFGSVEFLVRAGRLPQSALKGGSLSLPNGGRYYFDKDEEVIVRWQKWTIAAETEHGKKLMAGYLERRTHWETELANAPGDPKAQKALRQIQAAIESLKTPRFHRHEKALRKGLDPDELRRQLYERRNQNKGSTSREEFEYDPDPQPSSPEYRLTVLDLGLID